MPDTPKKRFHFPPLPRVPRAALAGGLAAVLVTGGLLFQLGRINANLKSSTKIMQGLRDEVDRLNKENQTYSDSSAKDKTRFDSMNVEMSTMKEDKGIAAQKQEELVKKMEVSEKTLDAQNRMVTELESRLKASNERVRQQRHASASLEEKTRNARSNPGVTPEYVKIVENEWLTANAKTEELQKDLNKTLNELSSQNLERSKIRSETATMHYNLAIILTEQGEYRSAIREYEKVLESRPSDADSYYNLAILYDDYMKDNHNALKYYRQYVRFAPDAPESLRVREWIKQKEFDETFPPKP